MAVHKHPESIPQRYYKPIGEITARFGYTDLYLQVLIWHFLKINHVKQARMLTFRLDVSRKIEMLKIIAKKWAGSEPLRNRINDLTAEANYIRGQRNNLVHGVWGYKPPKTHAYILFYTKELEDTVWLKRERLRLSDLRALVRRVTVLNGKLTALAQEVGAPPP